MPLASDLNSRLVAAGHRKMRQIADLLHAARSRVPASPPTPQPEAAPPTAIQMIEAADPRDISAAIRSIAREEPATVADARALIADPEAARRKHPVERKIVWMMALDDLRLRRANIANIDGGAA